MTQPVYALNLFNVSNDYIWHLFDKLEDLRPVLK